MKNTSMGLFDPDICMFVQEPKPINLDRLAFERWLVEQGKAEHAVAGPAGGPLVGEPAKAAA